MAPLRFVGAAAARYRARPGYAIDVVDDVAGAVRAYQEGAGKAATGFVDSADVTAGGGSATGSPSAGRRPICWPAAT